MLNLIENALRHTPAGHPRPRRVDARRTATRADRRGRRPGHPAGAARAACSSASCAAAATAAAARASGLAIVRAVAESHGGTVALERPPTGPGTRFVIRIPRAVDAAPRATRRAGREPVGLRPRRRPAAPSGGAAAGRRRTPRGRRAAPAGAGRSRGPRRCAARASERSTAPRMSSTSSSACSMNGTPRKITSGGATDSPVCSETVATTMKMPSADSIRRSRSATSAGSPMSTPSTKIIPDCSGSPNRAPRGVDLERQPVLAAEHVVGIDPDRLGELRRAAGSACGRRGWASRSAAWTRLSISLSSSA